jgi:phosphoglucosamine mutase
VVEAANGAEDYLDYLIACFQAEGSCDGLTIALDCANGASSQIAPTLWERLGARVIVTANQPDGTNINLNCGSTHPELVRDLVLKTGANIGIAHDGDADRVIIVYEKGKILDGDHILALCALHMKNQGHLQPAAIAATVMSNIGLNMALAPAGIAIESCAVGDRYVLETMQQTGARLGGEQSGHIIFLDYATTGDGLLSALKVVEVMQATGRPLSELAGVMDQQPQLLVNIESRDKTVLDSPAVQQAIRDAEGLLGAWGKVVVRPSGTEPKLRIMAQGADQASVETAVDLIAKAVKDAAGK